MSLENFMLPCPIKKTFGVDCFGCGSQRAILMIFEGQFQAAWKLFPAAYTLLIFFLFLGLPLIDKKRDYSKILLFMAIFNAVFMVVTYFFRHPEFVPHFSV